MHNFIDMQMLMASLWAVGTFSWKTALIFVCFIKHDWCVCSRFRGCNWMVLIFKNEIRTSRFFKIKKRPLLFGRGNLIRLRTENNRTRVFMFRIMTCLEKCLQSYIHTTSIHRKPISSELMCHNGFIAGDCRSWAARPVIYMYVTTKPFNVQSKKDRLSRL